MSSLRCKLQVARKIASCNMGIFHFLFYSETACKNLLLGYFAHVVRNARDRLILQSLRQWKSHFEAPFSSMSSSGIVN